MGEHPMKMRRTAKTKKPRRPNPVTRLRRERRMLRVENTELKFSRRETARILCDFAELCAAAVRLARP